MSISIAEFRPPPVVKEEELLPIGKTPPGVMEIESSPNSTPWRYITVISKRVVITIFFNIHYLPGKSLLFLLN